MYPDIKKEIINELSNKFNSNNLTIQSDIDLFNRIIFGSIGRLNELYSLFEYLSTRYNLIISSRGNADKIYDCLKLNNLGKFFDRENIYGTEMNKTQLIIDRLLIRDKVLYIDDNHGEHNDLLRYIKLIHVDSNIKIYTFNSNVGNYIFFHSLIKYGDGIDSKMIEYIKDCV